MLELLISFIKKEKLIKKSDTVLLAVSGGVDSVVMCELFHKAKFKFAIAHCNFQLRGKESEQDELFVEALAEKYSVPFHSLAFDTNKFAKKNKYSIQEAARVLRYQWFEELCTQNGYNAVATAHHKDDSIETFFINLLRGTGIKGLHGILPAKEKIIRPLLFANKKEILAFAKKYKLKYREDSSNASDKYTRNKIRHQLLPLLKEINVSADEHILSTIEHLRSTERIYLNEIQKQLKNIVRSEKGTMVLSIPKLIKLDPIHPYLFELLNPLGFNSTVVEEIITSLSSTSGKQFYSEIHRLVKDREQLLIESVVSKDTSAPIVVESKTNELQLAGSKLIFKKVKRTADFSPLPSKYIAQMDLDKLIFPLVVRKWQKGDVFQPIGMKGKKKLSDFFIDQKISLIEKDKIHVILSGNDIVWLVGHRIDDRYKVTNKTKKIFFVELMN